MNIRNVLGIVMATYAYPFMALMTLYTIAAIVTFSGAIPEYISVSVNSTIGGISLFHKMYQHITYLGMVNLPIMLLFILPLPLALAVLIVDEILNHRLLNIRVKVGYQRVYFQKWSLAPAILIIILITAYAYDFQPLLIPLHSTKPNEIVTSIVSGLLVCSTSFITILFSELGRVRH